MGASLRPVLLTAWLAAIASQVAAQPTRSIDLKQNWNDDTRQKFWFTSQGSRLIPYSWFLHLEQEKAAKPFGDPDNMRRLGYIPVDQPDPELNPGALPIGFARDVANDGTAYVGFTCAACHTSVLNIKGTSVVVEGAPTLGDFSLFLTELVAAMEATLNTSTKLGAFEKHTGANAAQLSDQIASLRLRWINQMPKDLYGPGRLDAFGGLYNQVVAYALGVEANARAATAPVSYPFLWDTPQHNKVQWNGSATNGLFGLGPVFRNIGEALGVFGVIKFERVPAAKGPWGSQRYQSSIRVDDLILLENMVKSLRSPAWPENVLGIDPKAVKTGKSLYKKHCRDCHRVVERVDTGGIKARMGDVGTDATMALNYADRFTKKDGAATGRLAGANKTFTLLGKFDERSRGLDIFANAILGTYLGKDLGGIAVHSTSATPMRSRLQILREIRGFRKALHQPRAVYKARPLNGIWATAPYLHNGSVPTVWELLKDPRDRVQQFYVGSRDLDDQNLGLSTTHVANAFLFDTSKPGNTNVGHASGTTLTDDEKKALLEYLKTL